jgi:hypothetical protein
MAVPLLVAKECPRLKVGASARPGTEVAPLFKLGDLLPENQVRLLQNIMRIVDASKECHQVSVKTALPGGQLENEFFVGGDYGGYVLIPHLD